MRAVAVALALLLTLTGCVSVREVPAPISDADLQAYLQGRLDAAWLNTGLDGVAPRPESDPATMVERYRDSDHAQDQSDCLGELGVTSWGMTERNGGPEFLSDAGLRAKPALQLGWYRCFATYLADLNSTGVILSRAESEYLYDYYQEWVIPCLVLQGYSVLFVPTREDYINGLGFGWVPYYNLGRGVAGKDPYADDTESGFFIELADECGDPFPGMPYGERYGF